LRRPVICRAVLRGGRTSPSSIRGSARPPVYTRPFEINATQPFGTGYSSLSYLKRFKIDKLKIDQSFLRDLERDPDDEAIVLAIIGMARRLGFKTIAEGVETQGQLDFLRAGQCDEVQGYFFSKPIPAAEFAAMLRSGETH
jgi:EAL domain-containing protein (putative c-di-GMP-specific phosphodiesterase class I)